MSVDWKWLWTLRWRLLSVVASMLWLVVIALADAAQGNWLLAAFGVVLALVGAGIVGFAVGLSFRQEVER